MKIRNFNNEIRNYVSQYYDLLIQENILDENEIVKKLEIFFDNIKDSNSYKYIIGLLYVSSYVYSYTYKKIENESKINYDYLNSFNSLDEFIDDVDSDVFNILLDCNWGFENSQFLDKKEMFYNIKNLSKLIEFFPPVIYDLMCFFNTYDKSLIKKDYDNILIYSDTQENAKKDTISYECEMLLKLEVKNHYNYRYLILEILEDYYRYNLYLINKGIKIDENTLNIINMIENELDFLIEILYKNISILETIINDYLEFELCKKDDIDTFYKDNKQEEKKYLKVRKQINNLK